MAPCAGQHPAEMANHFRGSTERAWQHIRCFPKSPQTGDKPLLRVQNHCPLPLAAK
ncbi:hypothetical protein JYU34_005182 [Plutella xylostella]|uniref:Uncharacterized protein n=1 Tax=Plutella xylostella TaxID=51655 RepID=A0ABQ7QW37_PLUXY|nr:hypothetical protein JYU34_005182 [Plutella xylostella]